jgi:hypothetical protein
VARFTPHGPYATTVEHAGGSFTVPGGRGYCGGTVRLLYSRRSNPQRWIAVGAYCDRCGRSVVEPDTPQTDDPDVTKLQAVFD